MTTVRPLEADDTEAYRALWLRALREHPTAFGASYEEEEHQPAGHLRAQIAAALPEHLRFGAFDGEDLIGIATVVRSPREKQSHRMYITGMYVDPDHRGRGVGTAIIDQLVAHAHGLHGVEDLLIAVTVGNDPACRLYERAGFEIWSRHPRYLKVDGAYYDILWMGRHLDEA